MPDASAEQWLARVGFADSVAHSSTAIAELMEAYVAETDNNNTMELLAQSEQRVTALEQMVRDAGILVSKAAWPFGHDFKCDGKRPDECIRCKVNEFFARPEVAAVLQKKEAINPEPAKAQ